MAKDIEKAKKRIRGVLPNKKNPLYNSHMYWSQKPYNICDILIEELSDKGDTVFDPFLGSGVTLIESIKNDYKRKAIGCEINEAPISIVNTLMKTYDLSKFHIAANRIKVKLDELRHYYTTICPNCGDKASITTVIFDQEDRNSSPQIKQINAICPNCKRISKEMADIDFVKMNQTYDINNIVREKLVENSKLAVYKDETIDEIFTNRNFKVLDEILEIISEEDEYGEIFRYVLMSILHLCKITDTHSNSQWPLWIPKKNCVEKNVIDIFEKKIFKFEETITYINENYDFKTEYSIINKGSQLINSLDIESETVNLIITDPPYLGQVAYSEYMQLYKPFLNLNINLKDEIIVTSTPTRKVTEAKYFEMLNDVFKMCDRVMVPGGYFCMYFHDCSLNVWDKLIEIMASNHFKYLSQEHIKKTNTLKNIISPKKSLSGDAIIFFVKDNFEYKPSAPLEKIEEIEENVIKQISGTIAERGPLSTPELYDGGLIEYLVYNGWLNALSKRYKTLVELFEKCLSWNPETKCWE